MSGVELLAERLEEAGFAVASLEAVTSGSFCVAGTAALRDGGRVFAKTLPEPVADLFEVEYLAELWCPPRPPASERFFAVYEELAHPFDGWRDQAQLLRIWDLFSVVAHGLDTWGAADIVRTLIAPFRHSTASRRGAA